MHSWKGLLAAGLLLTGVGVVAQDRANLAPTLAPPALAPQDAARQAPASVPLSPTTQGQHPLSKADVDAWLEGYMPYALATGDIAGAVVTVVKDGQIVTARGFGYADVDKRTPVDPERTLFRPGSVSKLVTWTAVMQQVEAGKIDLDADVNKYLDFKIPPLGGQPVTMRQMMTHTAGFEEAAKGIIFFDAKQLEPLGPLLKKWVPRRIFAPGTTPAYSNYATALAGYVVERVSGQSFDDYVDTRIFAPLGMRNSTFRQPLPANLAAQMSGSYATPGQPSTGFEFVGPAPAGSLSASGTDMARFMVAHLAGGELGGQRILSAQTAATMHDSPLDKVNPKSLIPPLNRMELGFFETNTNGREVIAHLGDLEAFHTSLHLFTKENVGFYVSFNSPGKAGAAGTLRTALFHDFADRYFPDIAPRDGRVDAKTAAQHAQMMTGVWQGSRRSESSFFSVLGLVGQAKIGVGPKGELVVPALVGRNGRPREWVEIAPFVWRDRDSDDRIAAQVEGGQVVRWSMDFMSPFLVYDRVPAGKSGAWLLPALYASLAVLLLCFLSWPVAWLARRTHKAPFALAGHSRRGYRATRLMAGLDLAVLLGWVAAFSAMLSSLEFATDRSNGWFWLLQIAGAIVFVGAVLISGWNMWLTWTDGRKWARKLWSVLVFLATCVVLYVAIRFGLIAMTVNY